MPNREVSRLVYFIRSPGHKLIKIGLTSGNPRYRLAALMTGSAEQLELIGIIEGCDPAREKVLHRMFAHLRKRGEWFREEPELTDYILNNAKLWTEPIKSRRYPEPKISQDGLSDLRLSERLRKLVELSGLSISDIAVIAGMEKQQCWRIIAGKNDNPGVETLRRIVEAAGGTMGQFFSEEFLDSP